MERAVGLGMRLQFLAEKPRFATRWRSELSSTEAPLIVGSLQPFPRHTAWRFLDTLNTVQMSNSHTFTDGYHR